MSTKAQNLYAQGSGTSSTSPLISVISTSDPTSANIRDAVGQYPLGKRWINSVSNNTFTLTSFQSTSGTVAATWVQDGGGSGALASLTGNSGTATPVAGNILIAGTTPISTVASGSTVTVSTTAVSSIPTQSGTATPASNVITINGAGGLTTSATGSTITITAGGSASVGSWTPVLNIGGSTTGITYSVQLGNYYQIGPIVWFSAHINLSSKGAQTGTLAITGVPVIGGVTVNDYVGSIDMYENLTLTANFTTPVWQANGSNLILWEVGSGQVLTRLSDTNIANNTIFIFDGFYFIN